jgi:hypothetical protein
MHASRVSSSWLFLKKGQWIMVNISKKTKCGNKTFENYWTFQPDGTQLHIQHLRAPHPIIYFCFRSFNVVETFQGGVSRARYFTVKISARNIEIYLEIKGQNMGVRTSQISLLFQTLASSCWF